MKLNRPVEYARVVIEPEDRFGQLIPRDLSPSRRTAMIQAAVLAPFSSGRSPLCRVVATAPMRVSLAGGGSDLPPFVPGAFGRIVGTAVDLRVRAIVEPFDRGWLRLEAPGLAITRRRGDPVDASIELRLLEAALARAGVEEGASLRIETEVIPGAGLGGSASAAVALLCALRASIGEEASPRDLAREAVVLERDGLRLACGAQDQMFAACGGFADLRFDDRGCFDRTALDPPPSLARDLGDGLLLVDTLIRRVSGDALDRTRRNARLETASELAAAAGDVALALAAGSLEGVLAGMRRSARAKLRRDPEGSRVAVDMQHRLEGLGAEVVRVCGAGSGGHVLVWARPDRHAAIASTLGHDRIRHPALAAPGVRIESDEPPPPSSRRIAVAPALP